MTYASFKKEVIQELQQVLPDEYRVDVLDVTKNNGVKMDGITIRREGSIVSPCIYLKEYYREYRRGVDMKQIIDHIAGFYYANAPENVSFEDILNADSVREHLVCRIVNTERNRPLLQECPHIPYLNLSLLFYIQMDESPLGAGAVVLHRDYLKDWNLTEEELLPLAMENTTRLMPADFMTMDQLLRELRGEERSVSDNEEVLDSKEQMPLFVLTNTRKMYGAVWMADPMVLKGIAEILESDYYLLPSSVHECMVIPAGARDDVKSLARMVEDINLTAVAPEEILADSVYLYSKDAGELSIAA